MPAEECDRGCMVGKLDDDMPIVSSEGQVERLEASAYG